MYYVSFLLLQGLSLGRFDGMVEIGDRVQIDEVESHYYRRCGIVIGDAFCPTFPYKVEFSNLSH